MPHPSELEEFGLEVEHDREHQSLVGSGPGSSAAAHRRHPLSPLSLSVPSREQRRLLQSINVRPVRLPRPGAIRWAVLALLLAVVVTFLHMESEGEEAAAVEASLPEVEEVAIGMTGPRAEGIAQNIEEEEEERQGAPEEMEEELGLQEQPGQEQPGQEQPGQEQLEQEQPEQEQPEQEQPEQEQPEQEQPEQEQPEQEQPEQEQPEQEQPEQELPEQAQPEQELPEQEQPNQEIEESKDNAKQVQAEGDQPAANESGEAEIVNNENDSEAEAKADALVGGTEPGSVATEEEKAQTDVMPINEGAVEGDQGDVDRPDEGINGSDEDAAPENNPAPEGDSGEEGVEHGIESADEEQADERQGVTLLDEGGNVDNEGLAANEESQSDQIVLEGSFTPKNLEDTRRAAQDLVRTLQEYYGGEEKANGMMLKSWMDPWVFYRPEGVARSRVDKLVDTMARALLTEEQDEFIIGTIGSSVTAGHDNCHYDSYQSQLERTFGPVWEAAGMRLVVQNAGEGGGCGDEHKNQVFCIRQNVSPDADIAHYSWTYFEEENEDRVSPRESLIRWAQMLPHQPPVHALNLLYKPEEKDEHELAEHYAKYGYNSFYMRTGHLNGGYNYEADKGKGIDRYAAGFVGDGYHSITRYGKNEANADRRESLGVVMRNWHPGPLAFEFISDTFAYVYSKAMLVALNTIQGYAKQGKDPREVWSASKRKILLKSSLPEPKFCPPALCVVNEAPSCLNYERPTFGHWGARVEDPEDGLNPHRGEAQNWEVWHEENDIWYGVDRQDAVVFQDREDKEDCRHLDQCGGISATSSENGMVVFRLPKMEVGLVVICGCCGKTVAEDMFINNDRIEIMYNGAILDRSKWDLFPNKKCARLLEKFPAEGPAAMTPTGHAYLSVKALEGLSDPVRISHVITL